PPPKRGSASRCDRTAVRPSPRFWTSFQRPFLHHVTASHQPHVTSHISSEADVRPPLLRRVHGPRTLPNASPIRGKGRAIHRAAGLVRTPVHSDSELCLPG